MKANERKKAINDAILDLKLAEPTAKHTVAVDRILRDYGMQIGKITRQALNDGDTVTAAKESYQAERKARAELGKLFMDWVDEIFLIADKDADKLRQRITDTF